MYSVFILQKIFLISIFRYKLAHIMFKWVTFGSYSFLSDILVINHDIPEHQITNAG